MRNKSIAATNKTLHFLPEMEKVTAISRDPKSFVGKPMQFEAVVTNVLREPEPVNKLTAYLRSPDEKDGSGALLKMRVRDTKDTFI